MFLIPQGGSSLDKRREKNLQVKAKITKAMFQLMKVKSLNDITITELIRVAGVARVSFYRNYDSKEDVLVKLIQGVLEDFRQNIHEVPEGLYSYDNIYLCFCYFEQYKNYVLDLCRSGFAMAILEELNRFHESMEGIMPSSSIERYTLYMYIGALFDTAVIWLSEENPVTTEEITAFFYQKIKKTFI